MIEGWKVRTGSRAEVGAVVGGVAVEGVLSARAPDKENGDCMFAGGLAAVARRSMTYPGDFRFPLQQERSNPGQYLGHSVLSLLCHPLLHLLLLNPGQPLQLHRPDAPAAAPGPSHC